MTITLADFNKIWASTSPLTPYSFSESNYKQGWNFIGSTPPARQMWDYLQKQNDEKSQYLFNSVKDKTMLLSDDLATTISSGADLNDYKTAGTYISTSESITLSLSNCPVTQGAFKMTVNYLGYGNISWGGRQIIFERNDIFVRVWIGLNTTGSWGSWKKFAYAEDVLALSGGTLTGALLSKNTLSFQSPVLEKGTNPSSTNYPQWITYYDKNGVADSNRICGVGGILSTSGDVSYGLLAYKYEANSTSYSSVYMTQPLTGDPCFRPGSDNIVTLGRSSNRWKELYAGTATINTSDERLKDNIEAIPDEVLDAWGDVNWYQYQFKDSIAEKGEKARLHTGAIAQRIESVFESHGLDANRYGLLCYDEWEAEEESKDENGNLITEAKEAGNRYSLRYEEALCMEAAYQRRRADRLEERIARLEALMRTE